MPQTLMETLEVLQNSSAESWLEEAFANTWLALESTMWREFQVLTKPVARHLKVLKMDLQPIWSCTVLVNWLKSCSEKVVQVNHIVLHFDVIQSDLKPILDVMLPWPSPQSLNQQSLKLSFFFKDIGPHLHRLNLKLQCLIWARRMAASPMCVAILIKV